MRVSELHRRVCAAMVSISNPVSRFARERVNGVKSLQQRTIPCANVATQNIKSGTEEAAAGTKASASHNAADKRSFLSISLFVPSGHVLLRT